MKTLIGKLSRGCALFVLFVLLIPLSVQAGEPTIQLHAVIDKMLAIMAQEDLDEEGRRQAVMGVVDGNVDFNAMAQRIIARRWKKSSPEDKDEFKRLFRDVLTNTYYVLLTKYTNERVEYGDEQIKKERYATVETKIISEGKKIPVTYRMINRDGSWKIYDFVAEGISLVRNYGSSYKATLKKQGLAGLNASLKLELEKET